MTKLPWNLIREHAEAEKIDPYLVAAIVQTESGGNPWTVRFEPKWRYFLHVREYADSNLITVKTEEIMQATSWGLMQVMGTVARELGLKDIITRLTDPDVNLSYGCKKLRMLSWNAETESDVIAAYNAGSVRKTPGGMYENQRYVDKVSELLRELREIK